MLPTFCMIYVGRVSLGRICTDTDPEQHLATCKLNDLIDLQIVTRRTRENMSPRPVPTTLLLAALGGSNIP